MRKIIALLALVLPTLLMAQTQFGYFSFGETVKAMPEYAVAQQKLVDLQMEYDFEIQRSEDELTRKYVDFLQNEKGFPDNIRQKRQKELQELMERNIAFKEEMQQALNEERDSLFMPIERMVREVAKEICIARSLAYVLNTDGNSYLYINEGMGGVDITHDVRVALKIESLPEDIIEDSPGEEPLIEQSENASDSIQ